MRVSVQAGEGLQRRMTVELPAAHIDQEIDARLKKIARTAKLPGFRPGKVPLRILRQRYGRQVQQEVFADQIQSSFPAAVSQEQLRPAGTPRIEPEIDPDNNTYVYTAEFEVLPQLALGSLEGVVLKRPVAEVMDGDVEDMIERLRKQRQTWKDVERSAQDGDQLTLSFEGTVEDEPFEGGSAQHVPVELGAGRMLEGFESGLVGVAKGEERTLELKFPDDYRAQDLAGKAVVFKVNVESVAEPQLPEIDENFAKAFGVPDGGVERFKQDVRENMERELEQRIEAKEKKRVMDTLLEVNQTEVPHILVQDEMANLKQQMRKNLRGDSSMELPDELFIDEAKRRVKVGLIIGEVVKQNNITVDQTRVREAVEDMASSYENPKQVVEYYYSNKEQLASVESLTLENQVVEWVMEQVEIEDEPSSFKALTE